MNDEQAKTLGMLTKTLPGFSWQPRMMNGADGSFATATVNKDGERPQVRWLDPGAWVSVKWEMVHLEDWPDFRDPPTMGWLLHQVREAWGDPTVFADKQAGHWECEGEHGGHDWMTVGDFEAEALVRALKLASEKNAATPREPHTGKGSARCPQ